MKFPRHLYKLVEWQMNAGIWNVLNTKSQNRTSKWQEFKKNTITAGWINQPKLKHSFNSSVEIFSWSERFLGGKRVQVSTFTSYHFWKQNMMHIYSYTLYITHNHIFFNPQRPVEWVPDAAIIPTLGRPRACLSKKSLQQKNVPASEVGAGIWRCFMILVCTFAAWGKWDFHGFLLFGIFPRPISPYG